MSIVDRLLKLAHLLGLVLFLGSILSFIVLTTLADAGSISDLAFARRAISAGTTALTVPGLWCLAVTGILLGWRRYGLSNRFVRIKLALGVLILLNAQVLVVPAVTRATTIAQRSAVEQRSLAEYAAAFAQEERFGAANILLAITAMAVGIWRRRATSVVE